MTKLKVLLLNPPFERYVVRDNYCCHSTKGNHTWAPVDLIYLSAILDNPQIELEAIDAIVEDSKWSEISSIIEKSRFDIIVALTGSLTLKSDMAQLTQLKQNKFFKKLYLMGNAPSFNTKAVMDEYKSVDGIFHNFLDKDILSFLLGENDKDFSSITYRLDDNIILGQVNIGKLTTDKEFSHAPRYDLFKLNKYHTPLSRKSPLASALTSFGCPYGCKFCIASEINFHERSIKSLKAEFEAMKSAGIKEIFFMDSTFNARKNRLMEVCNLLIENNYQFSWNCNIHCNNNDLELLTLMRRAGCHTVQIGVESANLKTIKEFSPTKSTDAIVKTFHNCHKAGLKTLGYFIIGFPEESIQEVNDTIDLAIKLNPFFASFATLMPDYGTQFYRDAVQRKYLTNDKLVAFDNSGESILQNTKLSAKQRDLLVQKAFRKFYLRPSQLLKYLMDFGSFKNYSKNGIYLLKNQILKRL